MRNLKKIFLDATPIIYFIQHNAIYFEKVAKIFSFFSEADLKIISSDIVTAESCVHAYRNNDVEVLNNFAGLLELLNVEILHTSKEIARKTAKIREAVAAMTLIFPVFTMILFVAYLISDGLVMLASYAQGKGDREEVDRLFSLGIILSVCCGIIFFATLFFLREEILSFWEISPELKFFANEYYSGIIFLSLLHLVSIFNYTIFFAEGMERACIIAASTAFVVNVILDIVLCKIIGVRGIGLATTFGTLVSVFVQIYFLTGGRSRLHFKWYWNFKKTLQGIIFSFYHTVDTLCISILPVLLSLQTINYFGEEKIIIVTVGVNLLTLILGVYTGIIDCMQPLVANIT